VWDDEAGILLSGMKYAKSCSKLSIGSASSWHSEGSRTHAACLLAIYLKLRQAGVAGASVSSVCNFGTALRPAVHTLAVWAAKLCTRGTAGMTSLPLVGMSGTCASVAHLPSGPQASLLSSSFLRCLRSDLDKRPQASTNSARSSSSQ
jgi:hypothetical protein